MKGTAIQLLRRAVKEELGQSAVMVALTITSIMALAGASVEVGHIYYAYKLLVASTNAATLAGAQVMPDTTAAAANVNKYSSATVNGVAGYNASPMLQNAAVTPSFLCLSKVSTSFGIACLTSTGATGGYNAMKVTQTASVPLWFGGLIGVRTMNIAAVSTASIKGGTNTPWNIAIILDTTQSMSKSDGGTQCPGSRESCALQGVRYLLSDLYPCAIGQTCTSGSAYVDTVSLFTFPALQTNTQKYDYCSGSGSVSISDYIVPALPTTASYQLPIGNMNGFSNDYRVNDLPSTGLNTTSNVVKAAGGASGCSGIQAPGGAGTFYAQTIYAVQTALLAQQSANPGSQDAMIILTDGDASASATYTVSKGVTTFSSSSQMQPSSAGALNGISSNNPTSYTYPSAVGECGQAVVAAKAAATAGTSVYTIGYGASTSGCSTDKTYSASVTTNGGTWGPGGSPCQALAAMASKQSNFYSDNGSGCKATAPSNANITQLTAIFTAITHNFTNARLIPNGTT